MPDTAAPNSMDDLIERYKREIDVTLIDANLRLTIDERLASLQRMLEFAEELRRAGQNTLSRP